MFGANKKKKDFYAYNGLREKSQCEHLCHAPFQNLLFVQSGKMMVCHYNRGFSIGTFPEQSIDEAWKGRRIDALRANVSNYEVTPGCQFCGDEIVAGNFQTAGCKKYDYLAGSLTGYPSSIEFQTSNRCNLECIMCSGEYSSAIRKNREQGAAWPDPYDESFHEQLMPYLPKLKFASFTGGEPFLNEQYYWIWSEIEKVNPALNITISTNGTILNDTVKALLSSLNIQLTVSIDSLKKDTYERIRKHASFDETMSNIRYLIDFMKQKQRLFSVKFVVMKENIMEIPELFEFFHSQGVQLYPKLAMVPFDLSLRFQEPEAIEAQANFLRSFSFSNDSQIKGFNIIRYKEMIRTLEQWREDRDSFSQNSLEAMRTEALEAKLFQMVQEAITNDEMTEATERERLLKSSVTALNALMETAMEQEKRRVLLLKLLMLPPFMVINELYRNNIEKFVMRFRS